MSRMLAWLLALGCWAMPALAQEALTFDIQLHEVADDRRPALERLTRDAARAAEQDLQMPLAGTLHVDYVGSPESFRRVLDSHGAQGWPENWISGLALLDQDRIIVQVNGAGALHTADTVRHELAHIAMHAVSGGAWLPRWYHEGVAMYLAGETSLERLREQAGAEAYGELASLADLNRGFGNDNQQAAGRAYAVSAGERLASLPDVPTAKEMGVNYDMSIWAGIFAPKGTPALVVAKLADALDKALDDTSVTKRIADLGGSVPGKAERTPAAFEKYVKNEIDRWGPILAAAK